MPNIPFNEIAFGYASAEKERAQKPDLLLGGYLDLHSAYARLISGVDYLILGRKGSGKSSVSQHLALRAQSDPMMFTKILFLADFPFSEFASILPGDREPQARYPTAWSLLLLLYLFDSLDRDQGSSFADDREFGAAANTLRNLGLLPAPTLREAVLVSSTKSFTLKLPMVEIGKTATRAEPQLRLPFLVDYLKGTVCRVKTSSTHLIILDGLDDILIETPIQYDALSALILETSRLNTVLLEAEVPAKFVVLCRTDIFERLPGANTNKIRQDSAVMLDWYHTTRAPENSELVQLVNLKARVSDSTINDVMSEYFPPKMASRSTIRVLLDHTRHTPRDLLQLLSHIQQTTTGESPTENQVWDGIRWYSTDYLLPEIKNDLAGFLSREKIGVTLDLLAAGRSNTMSYDELQRRAANDERFVELELSECLTQLFECSAIGQFRTSRHSKPHFTFRYRNPHATLDKRQRLIVHPGLVRALNLPLDSRRDGPRAPRR